MESGAKTQLESSKMCLDSLISYTMGWPFVICARRRGSLDWDGRKAVEGKSLQTINRNPVFAADNFSWDFPGEPISVGCWGGFGHTNLPANTHLHYTYLLWSKKAAANEVQDHRESPTKNATADVLRVASRETPWNSTVLLETKTL